MDEDFYVKAAGKETMQSVRWADAGGLDAGRVEAVSARAVKLGVLNCKGVASLLARKPESTAAKDSSPATLFDHANLRGRVYYH